MLIATALASLLIAAVVGVLRSLSTHQKLLAQKRSLEPWRVQVREQIQWDFENARQMSLRPNELRLLGYAGRDFQSGTVNHRPTEVVYFIHDDGRRHWLCRQEIHLHDRTIRNTRMNLVLAGVTKIELRRLGEDEAMEQTGVYSGLVPVPSNVRLLLWKVAGDRPMFDELFFRSS